MNLCLYIYSMLEFVYFPLYDVFPLVSLGLTAQCEKSPCLIGHRTKSAKFSTSILVHSWIANGNV